MPDLKFNKEIAALLVIDPYNDFISEGGKLVPTDSPLIFQDHEIDDKITIFPLLLGK